MKRTIFLIGLVSVLAVGLISCGKAYELRTIQLTAPTVELQGIGGTIQLSAIGTYTYGPNQDLSNQVTYTVAVDPDNNLNINQEVLPTPPLAITVSPTGLVTAVEPGECTYEDVGTATTPAWVIVGDYVITATYRGVTSQPVYIGMASAGGPPAPAIAAGACGPSTT